jgi:hypothetical protein
MTELHDIHQQQIDHVNNSGITVEKTPSVTINHVQLYGYVSIKDSDGSEIFLKDFEGNAFIAESRRLWNTLGNRTQSECDEIVAYPYAYLLAEIEPNL